MHYRPKKKKPFLLVCGGSFIYSGGITNGLYLLTYISYEIHDTIIVNTPQTLPLKIKFFSTNLTKLWHLRLVHINLDRINRLVREDFLSSLVDWTYASSESYLEGKVTKRSFPKRAIKMELIGISSYWWMRSFEYQIKRWCWVSRYGSIYLMHCKSETFERFKEFRMEAESQLG